MVLLFKSILLSFCLISKLKVIAFIKSLTITQGIILTLKRWFTPFLEIIALSFLLHQLSVSRFCNTLANKLNLLLYRINLLHDKHIELFLEKSIIQQSKKLSKKIINHIEDKNISHKLLYFYNLKNIILEDIANDRDNGVNNLHKTINHTDFWILNTSKYSVTIQSKTNNFPPILLKGNDIAFIPTQKPFLYTSDDIQVSFKNKTLSVIPLCND
jgi:hypothetical protein